MLPEMTFRILNGNVSKLSFSQEMSVREVIT